MSGFMSWIMSILASVVIGTILDIFLSEKKLGKMIRSVIASLIVLIIIAPIPSLLNSGMDCSGLFDDNNISLDYSYLEYAHSAKIKALEQGIEKAYEDKGYKNIKVKISAIIDNEIKINSVKIYTADLVIDNSSLNINKTERIIQLAIELLNIKRESIIVYE